MNIDITDPASMEILIFRLVFNPVFWLSQVHSLWTIRMKVDNRAAGVNFLVRRKTRSKSFFSSDLESPA